MSCCTVTPIFFTKPILSSLENMISETKIFAVVVTYNPEIKVHAEQLRALKNEFSEIVIVDNGSNENVKVDLLNEWAAPQCRVVKLEKNIGLASAQNLGINEARNNGATHVVLFDQDSVPDVGFLQALLMADADLAKRGLKIAAVGPAFYDRSKTEPYPVSVYFGPFIKRVDVARNKIVQATFIISSGSLLKIEALDVIGLMQDGLFIDFIDVEWCLRAKKYGYGVYVTADATMRHTVGDERFNLLGRKISLHSPLRRYYLFRNSLHMLRLPYIPLGYKIREITFNLGRFLVGLANSERKSTFVRFSVRGVCDGVRGRFGNYFDFYNN
jgi:rhamnosyltransferase